MSDHTWQDKGMPSGRNRGLPRNRGPNTKKISCSHEDTWHKKMRYMAHIEPCVKWVEKVKEMRGKLVILRRSHHLLHFYFLLAWFLDGSG